MLSERTLDIGWDRLLKRFGPASALEASAKRRGALVRRREIRTAGDLLRLALARPAAITLGVVLLAPALWLLATSQPWENAATDGLGLVAGATGAAFLISGLTGRQADWIDPGENRR